MDANLGEPKSINTEPEFGEDPPSRAPIKASILSYCNLCERQGGRERERKKKKK